MGKVNVISLFFVVLFLFFLINLGGCVCFHPRVSHLLRSSLCYTSDRQLSLDLVNVGRQRLDFLPMLEHSGTYHESAMHTGTFAQEIITLVHQVRGQRCLKPLHLTNLLGSCSFVCCCSGIFSVSRSAPFWWMYGNPWVCVFEF